MTDRQMQRLLELLFFRFEAEGTSLYALLDGARDPFVLKWLFESGLEHDCLFSGQLDPALRAAAPHIVKMALGSLACERLLQQGWGRDWVIFLSARAGLPAVRRHLRTFLRVQTENRQMLFFRYYDPRVMRIFLPTCSATQLRQIFGPIQRFDMEASDGPQLLRFRLIPEPGKTASLRSWTYDLSNQQDMPDDRG